MCGLQGEARPVSRLQPIAIVTTTEIVARFVETVNRRPRKPLPGDEVPPRLRAGCVAPDLFDWRILRSPGIAWIDETESRLPARFPNSYSVLVRNYEFPAFDVGGLTLFSNTREGTPFELRANIFADPHLSPLLLRHGFIPFARPATGSYDPMCFDAGRRAHRNEFPIVQLDHESVLCGGRLKIARDVARSFYRLVDDLLKAIPPQRQA